MAKREPAATMAAGPITAQSILDEAAALGVAGCEIKRDALSNVYTLRGWTRGGLAFRARGDDMRVLLAHLRAAVAAENKTARQQIGDLRLALRRLGAQLANLWLRNGKSA